MLSTELLLTIFTIFIAIIGFFLKRILDRTDEIKDIHRDITEIKPKVDILWEGMKEVKSRLGVSERKTDVIATKLGIRWESEMSLSNSPRIMNDRGKDIFEKFEVKKLVDGRFDKLVDEIREFAPDSAFELEEDAKRVMYELKADPKMKEYLKHKAYETGEDYDRALYVGALYLRDKALPLFDFPEPPSIEDVATLNTRSTTVSDADIDPDLIDIDDEEDENEGDPGIIHLGGVT